MLTRRKTTENDWRMPRRWCAAIYVKGLDQATASRMGEPSIDAQRVTCRAAATVLHAEVIGEFVDLAGSSLPHPGFERLMEVANGSRLDYLIVTRLDQLSGDLDEAFDIAWRLGFAGTVVIPADAEEEFPWTKRDYTD